MDATSRYWRMDWPLWHAGHPDGRRHHLVSPVTRAGGAKPHADRVQGTAFEQAAKRKRLHAYPELAVARRCKLVVLAVEVGGRFGPEAVAFLRQLARSRARVSPTRGGARACRVAPYTVGRACRRRNARRLTRCLSCPWAAADKCDGTEPPLGDLLADVPDTEPVPASRLPAPC